MGPGDVVLGLVGSPNPKGRTNELLASLTTLAQPADADPETARGLARADTLAASGRLSESLTEVTRVYEIGAKTFENK